MPPVRRRRRPFAATLVLLAVLTAGSLAACADDDRTGAGATTTAAGGHGDDHGTDSPFGGAMTPRTVSVADVAALGPGPAIGDRWSGELGLNVCGRFLEPPAAVDPPVAGVSTPGDGSFSFAPAAGSDAVGPAATLGTLLAAAGVEAGTGSMTLPPGTRPDSIELTADALIPVAGATFRTGERCGDVPAEVQLWVYSPDAVRTGSDVRIVVTDPEDVPVALDGMAFVLAFAPASSLPTLPPSALVDRG
jgi:hypothetical protein